MKISKMNDTQKALLLFKQYGMICLKTKERGSKVVSGDWCNTTIDNNDKILNEDNINIGEKWKILEIEKPPTPHPWLQQPSLPTTTSSRSLRRTHMITHPPTKTLRCPQHKKTTCHLTPTRIYF